MSQQQEKLIHKAYAAFNARDTDTVLALMAPDVHWPNGWEGGYVQGHEAVREYWARQWKEIDPHVEPMALSERGDGSLAVEVHQRVKDMQGNMLADGRVRHVYSFDNGLISRMEIEPR